MMKLGLKPLGFGEGLTPGKGVLIIDGVLFVNGSPLAIANGSDNQVLRIANG